MNRVRVSLPPPLAVLTLLAIGFGNPAGPARAQCVDPALTSGQSMFVGNGATPRFSQGVSQWTAIAVRPEPGTDWDLAVYGSAGPPPTCASGILASSVLGGSATDIVVGDFNHNPFGEYRARVYQYSGSASGARVEWDDGVDLLQVNGYPEYRVMGSEDVVDCYDVFLAGGTTYNFEFDPWSESGLRMFLFRNPANSPYWVGRSQRVLEVSGNGVYTTPPGDDWYGVVVVDETADGGVYSLGVGTCSPPLALASGVAQPVQAKYAHRTFSQSQPYFMAVGVRSDDPDVERDLVVNRNYGFTGWPYCGSATYATSYERTGTNFIVGDFNGGANSFGTYYATSSTYSSQPYPSKIEWDDGADQLALNGAAIARTTGPNDILECWDVYLPGPRNYSLVFEHDGPAALRAFVFHNPGAAYWVGRFQAHASGDASFDFQAPAGDWYGVVVVNDNGQAGTYRLAVSECATPPVLAAGEALSTTAPLVEIRPTQPAWTAVGTQWIQPVDDFDLDLFAEPVGGAFPNCVSGLLESSASSQVFVEFMAGDFHFNPPGSYFPRAKNGTGPFLMWEWDAGTDVLTVNAPPIARTPAASDLLECWDVQLQAGQTYTVYFEPDGGADLSAHVFSNPSAVPLWKGGDEADLVTTGHAHYVAPVTGWYGVVVVKRNPGGSGAYRLGFYQAAVAADPVSGARTRLAALLPNPAQRGTRIQYELASPAEVGFEITNVAGRRVALIPASRREEGRGSVDWTAADADGRRLGAGVYFVRMWVDGSPAARSRLVLMP